MNTLRSVRSLTPAARERSTPLGKKDAARPMTFPDASGVPANLLPVSDASAFDQLKRLLDSEGAHLAEILAITAAI
jgi:hypothetical protein